MKSFYINSKSTAYLLLFFVLASVFVKLFQIGYRSFSLDELYGVCAALEPNWDDFLKNWTLYDSNPPLYYFFLRVWLQVFPATEFWVRLPSVLAVLAAIYCFVNGVRKRFENDTWIWLLLLCGSSYGFLFFAQEARAYAFLFLFTVLQLLLFIDLLRPEAKSLPVSRLLRFTILSVLSAYTHYTGFIFSAILFAFLFAIHCKKRNALRQLLLMSVLCISAGLPWLPYFLVILKIDKSFILNQEASILKEIFSMVFFGYHNLGKLVSGLLLLVGPLLIYKSFRIIKASQTQTKALLGLGTFAAILILASPFLPYFYYYRHYMVLLPAVLLSVAILLALYEIPEPIKIVLLFLAILIVAEQGFTHYQSKREAWRESVQFIIESDQGSKVIVLGEPWEKPHKMYLMIDPGYLNLAIRKKTFYQFYFNRSEKGRHFELVVLRPETDSIAKFLAQHLKAGQSIYLLDNGDQLSAEMKNFPNARMEKTTFIAHTVYRFYQ